MERLREELHVRGGDVDQRLVEKLERCAVDWQDGRYRCRSPACIRCRRKHIKNQQRESLELLGHLPNEDLAFVTVVLPGTTDIEHLGPLIAKSRKDTANRFTAARRLNEQWRGTYLRGWHEVDALAPDHFAILPPDRRSLIPDLAQASMDFVSPTWVPTAHSIMFTNGLAVTDIADHLRRQWKLDHQVDVRPFDTHRSVARNLVGLTGYSNKFHCTTSLDGSIREDWPVAWQAQFFGYLNKLQRNVFESLKMTINQFKAMVME